MRLDRRNAVAPACSSPLAVAPLAPGPAQRWRPTCAAPAARPSWRWPQPQRQQLLRPLRRGPSRVSATELPDILGTGPMLPGLLTATTALSNALWRRAARQSFLQEVCRAFNVASPEELQDMLAALILCECVYKKVDMDEQSLVDTVTEFMADFPPGLFTIDTVQLSHNGVPQSYLLATGGRSIYAVFMGTKQARDMVADVNAFHEAVWTEALQVAERSQVPTAHRGFLARSKAIDVAGLYQLAQDSGRQLVLCGHSLGGAVAKLCALRLLREQPEWPPPRMRCITFASPAVGNSALAELVEAAGWAHYFQTYVLPEDQLMKALSFTTARRQQQPEPQPQPAAAAARRGAEAAPRAPGGPAGGAAGGQRDADSAEALAAGGREALSAVAGFIALPWTRELAKRKLRRELRAEEVNTTSLDAAATDAAEARATGTAPPSHQPPPPPPRPAPRAAAAPLPPQPTNAAAATLEERHAAAGAAAGAAAAAAPAEPSLQQPQQGQQQAQQQQPQQDPLLDPRNLSMLVQLQQKWAGHQLRSHAAAAAQGLGASLGAARSLVSPFHPFGEQWYISESGVVAPGELPADVPMSDAAAAFAAANPGIINFHRMMAYRTRVLRVIYSTSRSLRRSGLRLPPPASGPPPRPARLGLILPPIVVEAASARPLLPAPGAAAGASGAPQTAPAATPPVSVMSLDADGFVAAPGASPGGSPAGTQAVAAGGGGAAQAAAAAPPPPPRAPRKGPLAFLPGGRLKGDLVPLSVRVRGRGLAACRQVGITAFGEPFVPVELSHIGVDGDGGAEGGTGERGGAAAGGAWAQLASLQHSLRQRARRAAAAAAQAARGAAGAPPPWRPPRGAGGELALRVLLPRAVAARLAAAAAAGPQQHSGGPPPLVLQLRSDCQVVSAPVRLEPFVVGVVGTSAPAAALAAALLSGEAAAALEHEHAAGAGGGAPAPAARWRWAVPRPPQWLARRGGGGAAAAPAAATPAGAAPAGNVNEAAAAGTAPPQPDLTVAAELQRDQPDDSEANAGRDALHPRPQSRPGTLAADMQRLQRLQDRRERQRALARAAGGADWVDPWVAPGSPGRDPRQPAGAPGGSAGGPVNGAAVALQATPALLRAPPRAGASGANGSGGGGGPGSPKQARPSALSLRGARPAAAQLLPPAGKAATAAPVAAGPAGAGRARRRGGSDAPGSSRLPALSAAALDGAQLSGDAGGGAPAAPPLARRSWPLASAAAGLLGQVQGLLPALPNPLAPRAPPPGAPPAPAAAPAQPPAQVAPPAPAAAQAAPRAAADGLHGVRFVMLPHLPPPAGGAPAPAPRGPAAAAAAAVSSAAGALLPGLRWAQAARGDGGGAAAVQRLPRGLDALVVVADVDSLLLPGGAGAPLLRAAAAAGPPLVALLVAPRPGAPRELAAVAEAQLRALLGPAAPIAAVDIGGVASSSHARAQHHHAWDGSGEGGGEGAAAAPWWAPALAALPAERRAALRTQAAAARAALRSALVHGAEVAPPGQRSKL